MKHLTVIVGPTATGKTAYAIQLAQKHGTEIVSCDSRQVYSELNIGVARPSVEELSTVRHHLVACRSVVHPYDAYTFGQEARNIIAKLHETHNEVVAVGGSGLYIQALLGGVPTLPDPTPELRAELKQRLNNEGIESLRAQLKILDPSYYAAVDLANPARIIRALEVCLTSGKPYSSFVTENNMPAGMHTNHTQSLPYTVDIIHLQRERDELRKRIEQRVELMMNEGLLDEVRSLLPYRHLQPLNTVGYKELYRHLDGELTLDEAVQMIKDHTWQYAKKQITFFNRLNKLLSGNNL